MRITPQNLAQHLNKSCPPCFLLYGQDEFLIEESATYIKKCIKSLGDVDRITINLNQSDTNISALLQPSLFTSIRLIEVSLTKLTPAIQEKLIQLISHSQAHIYVLIQASNLKLNQSAPWIEKIAQIGLVIAHYPLLPKQFEAWLQNRAQQKNIFLKPQALAYIMDRCEGNCSAAAAQLELLAYHDGTTPHEQQSQFQLFSLTEAALQQNPERVIKIWHVIKDTQSIEVQLIIWATAQTLRALLKMILNPAQAKSILAQQKIPVFLHTAFLSRFKQMKIDQLQGLIVQIARIDRLLKTGDHDNMWREILDLNLSLSNLALPQYFFQK